jgi:hypothetical protein
LEKYDLGHLDIYLRLEVEEFGSLVLKNIADLDHD